jgi:hypothetical protein
MSTVHDTDIIHLIRDGLEAQIKEQLFKRLMKEHMGLFEKDLHTRVKGIVDRIAITGVESYADMMHLREEVNVSIHWDEVGR